jgi:glycosyltransferase involved in cell wall biosynthesis
MTPRILFVTHTAALGGAELYLRDVAGHLREHCAVIVFENGPLVDSLTERGVPTHVLPPDTAFQEVRKGGGIGASLKAVPSLVRTGRALAERTTEYDLVFANSQKALLTGALAARWARRPMIWSLHDLLTAEHFSRINRWVATGAANWATDLVLCNSEATERAFRRGGGRTPTALVYNGFDAGPFDAVSNADRDRLRAELGIGGAPTVGIFSRLSAWKGQHVLVEALATLPDVHALLVGDALFGDDDEYAADLQRQARTLGVADRVHWLGFRSDVPALMKAVDVVVHTSTCAEPFGRVIVEGMLAERPVVATRAGGAREIIQDGVNGLLTPPNDAATLAAALKGLLGDRDRAQALAREGAVHARETFSLSSAADRIANFSRQVVSAHGLIDAKGASRSHNVGGGPVVS